MNLSKTIKIQLAILTAETLVVTAIVGLSYMRLPAMLFGVGEYTVKMELAESGNLYANGNVTYRGSTVGQIGAVRLTDTGVEADLALKSDVPIPSDLDAEVHSQTAVGEQYVDLLPRNGGSSPLKDGDIIPRDRTSVPPDISELLDAANRGVEAIPNDNLKTLLDEGYSALAGLGPELSRLVRNAASLATDADKNLGAITTLIDQTKPVLDTQTETADSVQAWAAHLATVTGQLQAQDTALAGVLKEAPPAANDARQLFDRLNPTVPVVLANLVSLGEVAIAYQPAIEQLLVLLPQGLAGEAAGVVANLNTKQDYKAFNLSFNLNLNLPRTCTTGFLPAQQKRSAAFEDAPDRAAGDTYCRIPQDAMFNVRGARNYPCLTRPGKRAPTVKMCESDEQYVPLNDGNNWKGDPNATLSGQDVPQLPPGTPPSHAAPPPPPLVPAAGVAEYDPATGTYVTPDGQVFTQADLAKNAPEEKTWQSMLTPPGS